jgi:hypothetical protein
MKAIKRPQIILPSSVGTPASAKRKQSIGVRLCEP